MLWPNVQTCNSNNNSSSRPSRALFSEGWRHSAPLCERTAAPTTTTTTTTTAGASNTGKGGQCFAPAAARGSRGRGREHATATTTTTTTAGASNPVKGGKCFAPAAACGTRGRGCCGPTSQRTTATTIAAAGPAEPYSGEGWRQMQNKVIYIFKYIIKLS